MPDIVKIGITDNLERRIKELDNTSTPLPFECYYAVELEDEPATKIEKNLHRGLDKQSVRKKREFFNISPENAKDLLKIAEDMGGKEVTPTEIIVEENEDKVAIENAKKIKSSFNFDMINMSPGTILKFIKDTSITCEVMDEKKIIFRDQGMSLSKAAVIVLQEMGYTSQAVAGPLFWTYRGETLSEIRRKNFSS